jgi:hypothetical protein
MGNGRPKKPLFPGLESASIAHNDLLGTRHSSAARAHHRELLGNRVEGREGI